MSTISTATAVRALEELEAAAKSLREVLLRAGKGADRIPLEALDSIDFMAECARLNGALAIAGRDLHSWAVEARVIMDGGASWLS